MEQQTRTDPYFSDADRAFLRYNCQGNIFSVSSLSEFYSPVDSSGFAIKYVTQGVERYSVNRQTFVVGPGSYLLLNGDMDAAVEIDSKKNAKGVCINLSADLIGEAVASIRQPDTAFSDRDLADFFYTDQFLENQYQAEHTGLGREIDRISESVMKNEFSFADITTELFYELAEKLVMDQVAIFRQLQSVSASKLSTRRDLCRRLIRGREFIDNSFRNQLSVEQVAREAAMSEFHFYRLFRKVFGMSPYQYILRKRLEFARVALLEGCSVSQAALECGFSDIYSFSKAFKHQFGASPSRIYKGR